MAGWLHTKTGVQRWYRVTRWAWCSWNSLHWWDYSELTARPHHPDDPIIPMCLPRRLASVLFQLHWPDVPDRVIFKLGLMSCMDKHLATSPSTSPKPSKSNLDIDYAFCQPTPAYYGAILPRRRPHHVSILSSVCPSVRLSRAYFFLRIGLGTWALTRTENEIPIVKILQGRPHSGRPLNGCTLLLYHAVDSTRTAVGLF